MRYIGDFIDADNAARNHAEQHDTKSIHPKLFRSVVAASVDFLRCDDNIMDVLPVPQLHVMTCETKRCVEWLEKLDEDLTSQWLAKCNVMRERHGCSICGNDC